MSSYDDLRDAVALMWYAGRYEWQAEFGGTADEWAARAVLALVADALRGLPFYVTLMPHRWIDRDEVLALLTPPEVTE